MSQHPHADELRRSAHRLAVGNGPPDTYAAIEKAGFSRLAVCGTHDRMKRLFDSRRVHEALDALPKPESGYDKWGFSPESGRAWASLAYGIYQYFRPEIQGIENIPEGRVLIVPNHSGQLPFDGLVIGVACLVEAHPPRNVRPMVERWFPRLPYINVVLSRLGAVVGNPINCRNLLQEEAAILVFPEGAAGSGKTWDRRYKLERFGRGFMRLALQTNTPVVPVAVIGAEESIPSIHNAKKLAQLVGAPYAPVPALLPLLGPLAYLPLPTKFHVHFGEPMRFEGPFDDEDAAIDTKVAVVRDRVQSMVDEGRACRRKVF